MSFSAYQKKWAYFEICLVKSIEKIYLNTSHCFEKIWQLLKLGPHHDGVLEKWAPADLPNKKEPINYFMFWITKQRLARVTFLQNSYGQWFPLSALFITIIAIW
jgi:hypothetical protein